MTQQTQNVETELIIHIMISAWTASMLGKIILVREDEFTNTADLLKDF